MLKPQIAVQGSASVEQLWAERHLTTWLFWNKSREHRETELRSGRRPHSCWTG